MPIPANIRRRKKLSGIEGVSAGGVATVPITTGMSYDKFLIRYKESGTLADVLTSGIDRVRVVVDGDVLQDLSASQFLDFVLINGHTVKTGELPLHFTQRSRAAVADEVFTMLDLSNSGSAHLLINFNASATSPSIEVFAWESLQPSGRIEGLQFIQRREAFNLSVGGDGTFDWATLPKGKDISRIFFYHSGTSFDKLELDVDGEVMTELTTDENDTDLKDHFFSPAATNIDYPFIVDLDQKATSTIRALRKLLAKCSVTGAGQVVAVVETLEPLR